MGDNEVSMRIKRLLAPLMDARMVLRLTGMLATTDGVLSFHQAYKPGQTSEERLMNLLGFLQAWSMVVYYPLDNLYWLALHEVIKVKPTTRDEMSRYSCIAWLVYIVADMVIDGHKVRDLLRRQREIARGKFSQSLQSAEADLARETKQWRSQMEDVTLKFVTNFFDLIMAIHWSLKSSPFPPITVGFAGSISSLSGFYLRWKYT